MNDFPGFDLYEELEVSPRASQVVIQAAYRRLAREFHPDVARGYDERMTRINLAYEILSDAARRKNYDSWRLTNSARSGQREDEGSRTGAGSARSEPQNTPPPHSPSSGNPDKFVGNQSRRVVLIGGAILAGIWIIAVLSRESSDEPPVERVNAGSSVDRSIANSSTPVPRAPSLRSGRILTEPSRSATPAAPSRTRSSPSPTDSVQSPIPTPAPPDASPTSAARPSPVAPASSPGMPGSQSGSISFGDGVHLVGAEIAPGTYRTAGEDGSCSWERRGGLSGSYTDRIASGGGYRSPEMVTIETSDVAFYSNGCGTWTLVGSLNAPSWVVGEWLGTYECSQGQGTTGLLLRIESDNHALGATFEFFAVPQNPDVAPGSYLMTGNIVDGILELVGERWVSRPSGYEMVDLRVPLPEEPALRLSGTVNHPLCGAFTVERIS